MAVLDLDKAREAEIWKKFIVIVWLVVMAMGPFWAVMKPPGFVWANGRRVGGAAAAVFLFAMTVVFFACQGMVWFLLEGFPLEPYVGLILVLWSLWYVGRLFCLTAEFISMGVSLSVSIVFISYLIVHRYWIPKVRPLQKESATIHPID